MHLSGADGDDAAIRSFLKSAPACSYEFQLITHVTWEGKVIEPKVIQGSWINEGTNWAQILPSAAISNSLSRGRWGSLHWYAGGGDITAYDTEWNTNKSHPTCSIATLGRDMAYLVTRLGLEAVDFVNAHWDGNSFQADAAIYLDTPGAKRWKTAGFIKRKARNEWELSVTNLQSGELEGQSIVRGSVNESGAFEPQHIEIFKLLDKRSDLAPTGWTKLVTLSINTFATSNDRLYSQSFHPLRIGVIKLKAYKFYTNDILYIFGPYQIERLFSTDGTINYAAAERVYTRDEIRKMRPPEYRKPIFLVLVGIGLLGSMSAFYQRKRSAGKLRLNNSDLK